MKMGMSREQYVQYFNQRQPPECRKISTKILELYESKNEHSGDYNHDIFTLEKVREFLSTIPSQQYLKLTGEKQTRHRKPSLLKNTVLEIKAFPIGEELNHHWSFLAYDLENQQKYCWNNVKASIDRDKNQNQIYFSPPEVIEEFLALDLNGSPFTHDEKERIMKFLAKYGPYFIRYAPGWEDTAPRDKEWYFWHFWMDFDHFRKAYEIIQKGKPISFPHANTPSRVLEQLYNRTNMEAYTKWQENVSLVQSLFNICRTEAKLPGQGLSPHDFLHCGRGIGVICNFLYERCAKLLQCKYPPCGKDFFQSRKNQFACCPNHSLLSRVRAYKARVRK